MHDRLRVVGREPDRDAAEARAGADVEAGDRDGRHLEVLDVAARPTLRPTITARFSIRAARLESREVVTVAPFGSVVA